MKYSVTLVGILIISILQASADTDTPPRRWAIIADMNISCPTASSHSAPQGMTDKATYGTGQTAYPMRSNMHRHNFQIGLKAAFPFHFTEKDGNSLFDLIYMALGIYAPDDEPQKETKEEGRMKSINRVFVSY